MTNEAILKRVETEIAIIQDQEVVAALRPLLVRPRCEHREWDYAAVEQKLPCWVVLEHAVSNTCIAFCDSGFGPAHSWGQLAMLGAHSSMGMDSDWFASLEDAFRCSPAWKGDNPPGYEVN